MHRATSVYEKLARAEQRIEELEFVVAEMQRPPDAELAACKALGLGGALARQEQVIVGMLYQRLDIPVSIDSLCVALWGGDAGYWPECYLNVIRVDMYRIRRKLELARADFRIRSIFGFGYVGERVEK